VIDRIITIGAYGFDGDSFINALKSAGVDLFIDIRARRGMRGSAYAFANASRLKVALLKAGIRYAHAKELAPSEVVRDAQRTADAIASIAKRDRTNLSEAFVSAYRDQCLTKFDSRRFVELYCNGSKRAALFCVERAPAACHRSLVAQRLAADLGLAVENLKP
jgi:uncharacterized protein (DUF488 family)